MKRFLFFLFCIGIIILPIQGKAQQAPLIFPPDLRVMVYPTENQTILMVPFFIREDLYENMFTGKGNISFRTYLYDTPYDGTNAMIVPIEEENTTATMALWQNGENTTVRWDVPDLHGAFAHINGNFESPLGYKIVMLSLPAYGIGESHINIPRLYGTIRIYDKEQTITKEYFSLWLQWQGNPLRRDKEVESYIQAGSLTCEFASAKNALDMIHISVPERDLISRFPQASVYDITKNATDYFLGDYGFYAVLPQTTSKAISPLGGYGLHIDTPYLEKVILPFAPQSTLTPFSFSDLDDALEHYHPVIVQGLIISLSQKILGGWQIRINNDDTRGMVAGEHTYVVFEKTTDGDYRIKDPYKNKFLTISKEVLLTSVEAFEKYGVQSNMVIVKAK